MAKASLDLINRSGLWQQLSTFLMSWRPRPNSGSLIKDICFILILCFIQNTILPTFSFYDLHFDLVTPWLVTTAVRQTVPRVTVLVLIAALTLETRASVPAGMYLVSYWIFTNVIIQVRSTLSWRHLVPWLVTNLLSCLWLQVFISFVILMTQGLEAFTLIFIIQQLFKLFTAVAFGLYLCQEWLKFDAEEPVPQ